MANVRNGNTLYVDATGALTTRLTKVRSLLACASGGAGSLVLKDNSGSPVTKFDLVLPSGMVPFHANFQDGFPVFPNGISVTTATNVKATLVIEEGGS